jgi:hypothetical protein
VPTASAANRGALSSTDWSTFNGKQAALVSGTNIKTVSGVSLLGSGDVGTIGVGYGGTGQTSFTAGRVLYGNGASAIASSANLFFDGANFGIGTSSPSQKLDIDNGSSAVRIRVASTGSVNSDIAFYNGLNSCGVGVNGSGNPFFYTGGAYAMQFSTNATQRMQIGASGGVSIGNTTDPGANNLNVTGLLFAGATTSSTCHKIIEIRSQGSEILTVQNATAYTADFFEVSSEGFNGAAAAIWVGKNSSTNRSINAGGTVNASGADYAEYMTKANDFTLAKGDVVGIDANGKLTNVFTDAISFVVKSTDPSYVGGDTWGNEEAIGKKPEDETLLSEWEAKLEVSRQAVDRIAFAGQVPVNVLGATAGQYIVPVSDNGAIKGEAVSSPTFEQYQSAVGKVIAIETDGRARIIVKVA